MPVPTTVLYLVACYVVENSLLWKRKKKGVKSIAKKKKKKKKKGLAQSLPRDIKKQKRNTNLLYS